MGIPLPDIGHRNKVKVGKKVRIKPFLEKYEGEQQLHLSLRTEGDNFSEVGISPQLALQRAIEADTSVDLVVKQELLNPDPLVKAVQQAFLSNAKGDSYLRGDLRLPAGGNVYISVSSGLLDRSLRIMDTFIKAMRQRGHDFTLEGEYYKVVVSGEAIGMVLTEMQNRIAAYDSWQSSLLKANGNLMFKFEEYYISTICKDGKEQKLEQRLSRIISRLELAERLKKEREENEKRWAKMREEERIRKEFEERKKLEIKSFQQLVKAASRWKEAQVIREYINQKEQKARDANSLNEEMTAWLSWARRKVDWYDPFVDTGDEWLRDILPDKIMKEDVAKNTNPWFDQNNSEQKDDGWPLKPWYVNS
ncbi:hypothetical protein [Dyadobacter sp. 676]|uniref:Uncharacterized protein n=1 Tax=Dyadobacter sp. 676 TaxID=3088362 RepID=A0AAU8FND6_9BACT